MPKRGSDRRLSAWIVLPAVTAFAAGLGAAQTAAPSPIARYAATTANLKSGPDSVRIDVFAWSTDAARQQFVDAWNLILPSPARGAPVARGAAPGRGGRGTRGAAPDDGTGAGNAPAPQATRGGRGARGGPPATASNAAGSTTARDTPDKALAAALQSAEGLGYLWTSESVGYSLRYAYRLPQPDGGERIILATDRRLGEWDDAWKPTIGAGTDYGFSIIELRLNSKHEGEGRTSLSGNVAIDNAAGSVALENYAALPVTLKEVKPVP